jgi:prophage regulatory protein
MDQIVRKEQLPQFTGLRRTKLTELIEKGEFPKPVPIGDRAVGWLSSEIAAWQQSCKEKRDGDAPRPGLHGAAALLREARLAREREARKRRKRRAQRKTNKQAAVRRYRAQRTEAE